MPKPRFHLIYNQDCMNLFHVARGPVTPEHVDEMVDEIASAGVDVLLLNGNAQKTCHPSEVWETFWEGYEAGDTEFFGAIPAEEIPARRRWVEGTRRLAEGGCDYLARGLARCRERGMTPGITVRMNDVHDYPQRPDSHLFSEFYRAHPEMRLENPPELGWGSGGLNYARAEVRGHYLAYIGELVDSYEFDALDLDFLRFDQYFPHGEGRDRAEVMTGFVREVRRTLRSSGREIALLARVATTPEAARELGFAVGQWSKENLVDGVTVGAFLTTDWNMPVEEWRALLGEEVGLYVSTDYAADRREGAWRWLPLEDELLRGFAAGHQAGGADGVYLFNFFCAREGDTPVDPHFAALRTLDEPGATKAYLVNTGVSAALTDMPAEVPALVTTGAARGFSMLVGELRETEPIWVVVSCEEAATRLQLQINGVAIPGKGTVWETPAAVWRAGRNEVAVRNEGPTVTILGVEVRVGSSQ